MPMDVCKTVMKHIVLHFPIENVPCQNINGAPHKLVDPLIFGVGAMVAIMHHIHADTCHANANTHTE